MLVELLSQSASLLGIEIKTLATLLDFFLKSVLLVALALYLEQSASPFFSNSQKSTLWFVVLILLSLLPVTVFAISLFGNTSTLPEFSIVNVLAPESQTAEALAAQNSSGVFRQPLVVAYFLVLLLHLLRVCNSVVNGWVLRHQADYRVSARLRNTLHSACVQMDIAVPPQLGRSTEIDTPVALGLLRPTILLPDNSVFENQELLESVLLHELSHVKRRDPFCTLIAHFLASLYWFNPLVWYCLHRYRLESEFACDDQVILQGKNPIGFARQLVAIARSRLHAASPALSASALISRKQLPRRVENILRADWASRGRTYSSSATSNSLIIMFLLVSVGNLFAVQDEEYFVSDELRLLRGAEPVYPLEALSKGATGFVQYRFDVDGNGKVILESIELEGANVGYFFGDSATEALQNFVFAPRKVNGRLLTTSDVRYRFDFNIRTQI